MTVKAKERLLDYLALAIVLSVVIGALAGYAALCWYYPQALAFILIGVIITGLDWALTRIVGGKN